MAMPSTNTVMDKGNAKLKHHDGLDSACACAWHCHCHHGLDLAIAIMDLIFPLLPS
jgi:hypothetical protein